MARRDPSAGFTLIETLVALAVVSSVSVALHAGFVSSQRALARAEASMEATAAARAVLEFELADYASAPGTRRGVSQGLPVSVTSRPFDVPLAASTPDDVGARSSARSSWRALRVTIEVAARTGIPVSIETVHVARAP